MKEQKYTKRLVLWISPEMMQQLDELSIKTSRTKSELIREAIAKLIGEYQHDKGREN